MSKSMFAMASSQHALVGRGGRMRKRGGQVVSFAPNMVDLCGSVSRVAMGGILVLAGALVSSPEAKAGTFTIVDDVYVLSGATDFDNDTGLRVNQTGTVAITTTPDSGLGVMYDPAISATGSSVSFVDTNGSVIASRYTGLQLQANSGQASITSNGTIQGDYGDAITIFLGQDASASIQSTGQIRSAGSGGGIRIHAKYNYDPDYGYSYDTIGAVDIDVAEVWTRGDAIRIEATANGPIDITSTGPIQSARGYGISVTGIQSTSHGGIYGDVNINAASVTAYEDAIHISVIEGDLTINADSLTSFDGDAIDVFVGTGNLTINAGSVASDDDGIDAYVYTGNANITVDSIVADDDGIYASVYTGNANITVDSIVAGDNGIDLNVEYGNATIEVNSIVAGDRGIDLNVSYGNATIDVNSIVADDDGIRANVSVGDLTINAGNIQAYDRGIKFGVGAGNASITVNKIDSGEIGIYGDFADGQLDINAKAIFAEDNGIDIGASNAAVNIEAGHIVADYTGIKLGSYNSNTSINVDSVQAGTIGIDVNSYGVGDVSITAQTVNGGDAGIDAYTEVGNIRIDLGSVNSDGYGISAKTFGGDISITSSGRIGNYAVRQKIDGNGIPMFDGNGVPVMETVQTASRGGGIRVNSYGNAGDLHISANEIETEGVGIVAIHTQIGDVNIEANSIKAAYSGIFLYKGSDGDANISVQEIVSDGTGVFVVSDSDGAIRINAKDIDAQNTGIQVYSLGSGDVSIVTTGHVQGSYSAINVRSNNGDVGINIASSSAVEATNGTRSSVIIAEGSNVSIVNNGVINGQVASYGDSAELLNNGRWNIAQGRSEFGSYSDRIVNSNTGIIIAASDANYQEYSAILGAETFANNGVISLSDGGVGDELFIGGNATFGSTSTLRVDVDANGGSDVLVVGDTLTIAEGATLDLLFVEGVPVIGQRIEVATAGEVIGTFADSNLTAFLGLRDQGIAGSVTLDYVQLRDLNDASETSNQSAVATALDNLAGNNALKTGLLNAASDDAARNAFDQLAGDVHASVRTAMAEDSRLTRNAVLDRLSHSDDGNVWGQVFWNSGSSDGNRNAANTKRETWGVIAGADAAVTDNLLLGFAAAYQSKDVDQGARSSDAKIETISLLGYVGAQAGALRVKAGAGYAWGDVETSRSVRFGSFSDRLTADYNANLFQAFAEAGVRLPLGSGFVEPMAQIAYLSAKTDGFVETGGLAALTAQNATEKSTISTLGARFATAQIGVLNFTGLIGWQHSFGSLDPQTSFRFAGSDRFDITGAAQSRNAGVANVAAQIKLSESANLSVGYDGVLGNAGQDHAAKVGFRFAF